MSETPLERGLSWLRTASSDPLRSAGLGAEWAAVLAEIERLRKYDPSVPRGMAAQIAELERKQELERGFP